MKLAVLTLAASTLITLSHPVLADDLVKSLVSEDFVKVGTKHTAFVDLSNDNILPVMSVTLNTFGEGRLQSGVRQACSYEHDGVCTGIEFETSYSELVYAAAIDIACDGVNLTQRKISKAELTNTILVSKSATATFDTNLYLAKNQGCSTLSLSVYGLNGSVIDNITGELRLQANSY
jgi:hypothetical protein